jgi:group I intron endonuclease
MLNKHPNSHLQRAWLKYGEVNFTFTVIEICDKTKLIEREQHWINNLNPAYNKAKVAGNTAGVGWSKETRDKQIALRTGKKRSQEEKNKISLGMIGIKNRLGTRQTEETRLLMRNAKYNKTQEQSDNQSAAQRKLDKWPCLEGSRCKCHKCNFNRQELARQSRLKMQNKEL